MLKTLDYVFGTCQFVLLGSAYGIARMLGRRPSFFMSNVPFYLRMNPAVTSLKVFALATLFTTSLFGSIGCTILAACRTPSLREFNARFQKNITSKEQEEQARITLNQWARELSSGCIEDSYDKNTDE
ncbi:hypothetical protein SJAG_05188 [Schizosaccharomyces japonicus yFS275]|uniref:Uncharacterized protein n=1 Tax=Schizosaccharomyces japonicus (strain yFS275 / FY16936) TaxID=402676 RepID=B6JVT1_SCHJY|nr:hypothetical protein SJAG_05188 [Schizosaccharomyces japonicus yFS275]EEB05482.1 hypothetical protein SJAG_05188 [Schizosaccharomyces japonicus yFS275]